MTTVNIDRLKQVSAANPKYKAIFELYGKRLRGRQDSTVPRIRRVLKDAGIDMSTQELSEFYAIMQDAGAGRWVAGRNGNSGRFIWGFHLKSIADNVNGCKYELDQKNLRYTLDRKTKTRVIDRDHSGYITLPLEAEDVLRSAPRPKIKLPHLPTPAATMIGSPAPVVEQPKHKRTLTVRKAGFEIDLPMDEMNAADWKDAAVFLNTLSTIEG